MLFFTIALYKINSSEVHTILIHLTCINIMLLTCIQRVNKYIYHQLYYLYLFSQLCMELSDIKQDEFHKHVEENLSSCEICEFKFDNNEHKPYYICSYHHTICKTCLYGLKELLCPKCREPIDRDKASLNNTLLELVLKFQESKNQKIKRKNKPRILQKIQKNAKVHPLPQNPDLQFSMDNVLKDQHRQDIKPQGKGKSDSYSFKQSLNQYRQSLKDNLRWVVINTAQCMILFFLMVFNLHIGSTSWQSCNENSDYIQYAHSIMLGIGYTQLVLLLLSIFMIIVVCCDYLSSCQMSCPVFECMVLGTWMAFSMICWILTGMYLSQSQEGCKTGGIVVYRFLRAEVILSIILTIAFSAQFFRVIIYNYW